MADSERSKQYTHMSLRFSSCFFPVFLSYKPCAFKNQQIKPLCSQGVLTVSEQFGTSRATFTSDVCPLTAWEQKYIWRTQNMQTDYKPASLCPAFS